MADLRLNLKIRKLRKILKSYFCVKKLTLILMEGEFFQNLPFFRKYHTFKF